jgi:nucleotide-binding universal stress UspA family protein
MTAKHILVPTDFSEYANYALDYAIELAYTQDLDEKYRVG